MSLEKTEKLYVSATRGMRRTEQGTMLSAYCENAALRSRFKRFLLTLFPYFFPTQTAIFNVSEGI